MEIKNFPSQSLADKAGGKLAELLRLYEDKEIFLLLSGGSSMQILEYVPPEVLGSHITIAMLDERFNADPAASNFLQLKKTNFYKRVVEAGANVFNSSPMEGETIDALADRFEKILREWRRENPKENQKGVVLATFGIGEDGHLAGMMPFPEDPKKFGELFLDPSRWAIGYDAGAKNRYPLRVTTTLPFLSANLTAGVSFVAGAEKRVALSKVLAENGALAKTPARFLHEISNLILFTDQPI